MPMTPPRAQGLRAAWLLLCVLPAVPSHAGDAKPNDPLEKLNRATYAFNDALDRVLLKPVARAYKTVAPQPVRGAVSNFLANIYYPDTALNQFLQGKFRDGVSDSARFVVNTTIGIGGFFDPATRLGLVAHDEDFGQTFGHWGVPAGPYLVLPLLGPSDFRDAPSRLLDTYAEVPHYLPRAWRVRAGNLIRGAYAIDQRQSLIGADEVLNGAFDPYALLRDTYVRRREFLVHDGKVTPGTEDELAPEPEDPAAETPQAPATPTRPPAPGNLPWAPPHD